MELWTYPEVVDLVRFHLHKPVMCYMTLYGNNSAFENHWAVKLPSPLPVCMFYALHTAEERSYRAIGWQKAAICPRQISCPVAKKPWELQDPGPCPALCHQVSRRSILFLSEYSWLRLFICLPLNCVFFPLGRQRKNKAEINLLLEYTKVLEWNSVL